MYFFSEGPSLVAYIFVNLHVSYDSLHLRKSAKKIIIIAWYVTYHFYLCRRRVDL